VPDAPFRSAAVDIAFAPPSGGLALSPRKNMKLLEIIAPRGTMPEADAPVTFPAPNLSVAFASGAMLWTGPGRYLSVEPESSESDGRNAVHSALGAVPGLYLTDVSHSRFVLRATGVHVREFLAKSCPLDLHIRAFPSGACAQSLVADVPMLLHAFDDAGFDLFMERSLARAAVDLLIEQAGEFSAPQSAHPKFFGMNESMA
jgi:sarcosine oxidase subunit gamma